MVQQFRDSEVGAASLRAKCATLQQELCATQSALLDAQEEVEALRGALRLSRAGHDAEREGEAETAPQAEVAEVRAELER
eukprot:6196239-Pleurochrysis_carterae.AAC.7